VSVSPNHFYPWANEGLAGWVAGETNRLIAEHVAQAPDRLIGLGVVPLQHPERIVEYLDDAVLGRGLAGVEISSFAGDVELSDERLEPFWARAAELGCVVFLHPFGCSLDERLDRFYLSNTVGQPVENAVALSHLIFAGVLDRHPGLRIVAAHGGGYLPFAIGRSDRAWRVRPEAHGCAEEPSTYLRKLWFDTVVHDEESLRRLVEIAGPDRVLLGSDFPFDMGLDDPAGFVRSAGLADDVAERVLGGNAAALLGSLVRA
jgi:aminocarboxymuconate-semialdehyde decarboxylase